MKTYTGFEAIERMKTNWIKEKNDFCTHIKKGSMKFLELVVSVLYHLQSV